MTWDAKFHLELKYHLELYSFELELKFHLELNSYGIGVKFLSEIGVNEPAAHDSSANYYLMSELLNRNRTCRLLTFSKTGGSQVIITTIAGGRYNHIKGSSIMYVELPLHRMGEFWRKYLILKCLSLFLINFYGCDKTAICLCFDDIYISFLIVQLNYGTLCFIVY